MRIGFLGWGQVTDSAALPALPGILGPIQTRTIANALGAFTTSCQGLHSTTRSKCGPGESPPSIHVAFASGISIAGSLSTMRWACGTGPPDRSAPIA